MHMHNIPNILHIKQGLLLANVGYYFAVQGVTDLDHEVICDMRSFFCGMEY
jgi:hypothetical protein